MFAPRGPVSGPNHARNDEGEEDWRHDLKIAVLTAGLTAVVTGLGEWAIDELREKFGKARKAPAHPPPPPKNSPPSPSPFVGRHSQRVMHDYVIYFLTYRR